MVFTMVFTTVWFGTGAALMMFFPHPFSGLFMQLSLVPDGSSILHHSFHGFQGANSLHVLEMPLRRWKHKVLRSSGMAVSEA